MALERMFTLGLDFGTNSVRALVVRCSDGVEYGSRIVDYPSGTQGVLRGPLGEERTDGRGSLWRLESRR